MTQKQFNESEARKIVEGRKLGRVMTRDGMPVRILSWDVKSRYRIAGVVMLGDDEYVKQWTAEGKADYRSNVTTNLDLILETEGGEA